MGVIIIGGGASGIACAIRIKQNNRGTDVVVLEHLDTPLKKILATGNGRCNMTNRDAEYYAVTTQFFRSIGLVMRDDSDGRVYPYSNQAATVVETMMSSCDKLGVQIVTDCAVSKVEHIGDTYNAFTDKGIFTGEALVLATGGISQPSLGSDGSGYALAKQLGHTITNLSPALVQLKSSSKNCRALKGLRTKCNVRIENNGETVAEEYGELLFTDYGISGIVVMDLSQYTDDNALKNGKTKSVAVIDFVPEMSEQDLAEHYEKFGTFNGILPHKLCTILARQSEGDTEKMIRCIKNQRLIITGTKGYDFAQITKGGVPNSELTKSKESTTHRALYIIGEMTDNQYKCGGYNLDHAFASGIIAADDIYNRYKND